MKKYQPGEQCLVMTREQARAFDAWAIDELGIQGVVLMENAGRSCEEFIEAKLAGIDKPKVRIFCGTGNNGGDGFVIARHLINKGFETVVVICGDKNKIRGDARTNLDILANIGALIEQLDVDNIEVTKARVAALTRDADMIVDAIFGTGLKGVLSDVYMRLIEVINQAGCSVLAIDIPSGLDCDTGLTLGAAIKADWTVTFAAVKTGFVPEHAQAYTGQIYVASIGVEPASKG